MGPEVTVIYRLRDREYDRADVEIEYGVDIDHDGEIDEETEYFTCTEVPHNPNEPATSSSGTTDLLTSPGIGTIQYFVWDSLADLDTGRHVTQDYVYTTDGRIQLDEFGDTTFQDFPGVRIRIRPTANNVTGAWKTTDAFDVNSNNPPTAGIGAVELTSEGTVNEDVVLNWTAVDPDNDAVTIAVDWVEVPGTFNPASSDLDTLEALPWQACTTGAAGEGTFNLLASPTGLPHVWSWDSVADAGTMNGYVMFRMRPLDAKLEKGSWRYMLETFHLDNYTIFTDPDAQLPDPSFSGRAILLSSGQVLYVGGSTGTAPSNAASIFYPGLSQTTMGNVAAIEPGLSEARMEHTATRLADGNVLITGGRGTGGTYLDSAELYDPDGREFIALAGTMQEPRHNHTATLLRDGRVLIAGGANADGIELSAEVFDPQTRTFEAAGDMSVARTMAQAALLPGGRVLIAGGEGTGGSLEMVEIFDPIADAFLATDMANDMGEKRSALTLTATTHDPMAAVAAGGSDAGTPSATIEGFDWENDVFMAAGADMQDARAGHIAVLLGDGKVLLAGGMSDGGLSGTGDIFDVEGDSIDVPNGDMVVPVAYSTVACLANGRPVMFGGQDGTGAATAQIQVFTPDGGFNLPPIAQVRTPTAVEPWLFGVRFYWRATDSEGDPVKINAQFRIKPSESDDSGALPSELMDVWLPATMKDKTVLGERSSGVTGLSSRVDYVTELQNPMDAPDVDPGEHLFIWYCEEDIPLGNYDNVFFRIDIEGATPGTTADSGRFSITDNAPVIARIQEPLNDNGNVVVPFYLQDSDSADNARVEWDYAIDLNGDGKIVESDFEEWLTVTRSPVTVTIGTDSYTDSGLTDLVSGTEDPDPNNDYTTADGIPWGKQHHMIWDSVYDLGAPAATRNDIILRATPYDFPATDTSDESLGIANQLGGFDLQRDPNGLILESWTPSVNGTAGTGYTFGGVKVDEPIVLTFSKPVAALSATTETIQFTKIGGTGEKIDGFFHVDNSTGKGVVTFYPQVQELPTRTDVLENSSGYDLLIPAYDPASRTTPTVEQDGALTLDTNGRFCLAPTTNPAAFQTGIGALMESQSPTVGPLVTPSTTLNVATDSDIEFDFSERIASTSVNANGFLVTTELYPGVKSVVYGEMILTNTTTWDGTMIVHSANLVFRPDGPLPVGATISIAAKTGLTDLYGNALAAGSTSTFDTVATGTTKSGSFAESFDDDTEQDASLTSAFWGTTDPIGATGSSAGLGVSGSLTGMHELGSGTDEGKIVWDANDSFTIDTTTDSDNWQFKTLKIPAGHTLYLTGPKPVTLRVFGDVLIEGTIDVAGRHGEEGVYYDSWSPTQTGLGAQGGRGGAGGGKGGSDGKYTWKQTTRITASDGVAGYGATTSNTGKSSGGGLYSRSSPYSYDYYGGGASGAGHADAGDDGTYAYYSGTNSKPIEKGGASYGSASLSNGLEGGSGGGAGGGIVMSGGYPSGSYVYEYWGFSSGGAGGGGGGALKIIAGGTVTLTNAGKILASGGDGGDTFSYNPYGSIFYKRSYTSYTGYAYYSYLTMYPGGGGGGSGGSIHVMAGGGHAMHGKLDVSGGEGGQGYKYAYKYQSGSYSYSREYNKHWGGDGGDGRLKVDGPAVINPATGVNFQGVVVVGTATAISGGTGTSSWTVIGSATVNTDTGSGAPTGSYSSTTGRFSVKDFTVSSGSTLTVTGTKPLLVYASGDVDINGTIDAAGNDAANYPVTNSYYSSSSGWRPRTRLVGATAVAGGGAGGASGPSNVTSTYSKTGLPGEPGMNARNSTNGGGQVSAGWVPLAFKASYATSSSSTGTFYDYLYYYFGGTGGGGGSAETGGVGEAASSYTGFGIDGSKFGEGGTPTVDAATLNEASLTGGGGGAGGGKNAGRIYAYQSGSYSYTNYYAYGNSGAGGAGGGAVMIRTSGELTMGSSGQIDVSGGHGTDISAVYSSSYEWAANYGSPGGGGGGGSVLLEAKDGFSLGAGCTINAAGGRGGIASYKYAYGYTSGTYSYSYDRGTTIYSYGGDGSRGAVVLRAESMPEVLNVGQVDLGDAGSFDSGTVFLLTQDGVSKWQDSGTHAPDFLTMTAPGTGIANLYIEGAHIDPMTGNVDASTASGWIALADINDADGYRFFRFKCELVGSTVTTAPPTIDSVTTTWQSVH